MANESAKIADEINQVEKDIHFYKVVVTSETPPEFNREVRKLLEKAENEKRHLKFKLDEAKRREAKAAQEAKKH